jgi:hypothetical protein
LPPLHYITASNCEDAAIHSPIAVAIEISVTTLEAREPASHCPGWQLLDAVRFDIVRGGERFNGQLALAG